MKERRGSKGKEKERECRVGEKGRNTRFSPIFLLFPSSWLVWSGDNMKEGKGRRGQEREERQGGGKRGKKDETG